MRILTLVLIIWALSANAGFTQTAPESYFSAFNPFSFLDSLEVYITNKARKERKRKCARLLDYLILDLDDLAASKAELSDYLIEACDKGLHKRKRRENINERLMIFNEDVQQVAYRIENIRELLLRRQYIKADYTPFIKTTEKKRETVIDGESGEKELHIHVEKSIPYLLMNMKVVVERKPSIVEEEIEKIEMDTCDRDALLHEKWITLNIIHNARDRILEIRANLLKRY